METIPKNHTPMQAELSRLIEISDEKKAESLFQVEYQQAIERFVTHRAEEEYTEFSLSFGQLVVLAEMQEKYELLDDIPPLIELSNSVESICTVTIPVAILSEDIDRVMSVVEKIEKSNTSDNQPIDVILWANAQYLKSNKSETEAQASKKYLDLVEQLKLLDGNGVRIKAALQMIEQDKFSMSKLRSDYMDAVCLDTLYKGYGFNHPIMWVDADMTNISKGAVAELADLVRTNDVRFGHANLQYSIDWSAGELPDELDDPTKAVLFNEIQRRQFAAIENDREDYGYAEESGLVFTAGLYLNAGGVDTGDPMNESLRLRNRAEEVSCKFEEPLIPLSINDGGDCMDHMQYIKTARMSVSGRRHYEIAKEKGAAGLYDVDASGYGDKLFTHRDKLEKSVSIDGSDLRALSESNSEYWHKHGVHKFLRDDNGNILRDAGGRVRTEKFISNEMRIKLIRNKKIADRLIERYFKD
jgi:hypothetical protein